MPLLEMRCTRPVPPLCSLLLIVLLGPLAPGRAPAAVVATSGTVMVEPSPHAEPADGVIFVYDEQQDVAFVSTQPLQFGAIAPGTPIDSHYVQFDPASPIGSVGTGTIRFDGPILGVATSTGALTANLAPEAAGTSDDYFGLAATLGPYPTGVNASARGLGSPQDDLVVVIGSNVLTIESLEIPSGGGGNLDGFRVFTDASARSVPGLGVWTGGLLLALALVIGGGAIARARIVSASTASRGDRI